MAMALMLARRGLGTTMPNPAVGAVIVQARGSERHVVGRGWTQAGGRPHAEVEALRRAGDGARGGTLYVTLEPCSHFGRSPPCADAIVAAGMARVVIGTLDPDSRVAGRGIARLRDAGIEVVTGVLGDDANWVSAGHILRVAAGRPFVQLKLAVSLDGLIAPGTGTPVWVTGPRARAEGHLMRARADAILVGRGTVAADDPDLTCRLPGLQGRSPIRVVLDGNLGVPLKSRLVRTAGETPLILVARDAGDLNAATGATQQLQSGKRAAKQAALEAQDVDIEFAPGSSVTGLDPNAVLGRLARRGITRLMVEGGPHVARSFLDAGLVDEIVLFRGGHSLDGDGLAPLVDRGLDQFDDSAQWRLAARRNLSGDQMSVYQSLKTTSMLRYDGSG